MIGRLRAALHREGLSFFSRRIQSLARRVAGYERVLVYGVPSGAPRPPADDSGASCVELATPAEALAADAPWDAETLAARMGEGARLFAVRDDGAHTSFGWVTTAPSIWVGEVRRTLAVPRPLSWIWDCVTPDAFRGRGYYPRLLHQLREEFGDGSVIIYCRAQNAPSRRGITKAGFVEVASVMRIAGFVSVRSRGAAPERVGLGGKEPP
ncbi:MAG TPA: hypothetical protein VF761_00220 [Gemmatimonadaceae bacterium]